MSGVKPPIDAIVSSAPSDSSPSSSSSSAAAVSSTPVTASSEPSADVLVQYIVMRGDLVKTMKWNVGGLIANGSHACVSIITENLADPDVKAYINPAAVTQMHKVVLSAKDEAELGDTSEILTKNNIKHKVWVEQPENYRSCLAVKPYPRSIIQPLLKHLKLFR